MRALRHAWDSRGAFLALGFALTGCAATPCSPHYYHTLNEGAVRRPPDEKACAEYSKKKRQASASAEADAEPLDDHAR